MKVLVISNRDKPYVSVQLGLLNGAATEEKPGAASMALDLLTKGTKSHTEKQLAEELETYAIELDGHAAMDSASVNAGCLPEHLERATRLMGEVVKNPTFPNDEFEKRRKQLRTTLAMAASDPSSKASKAMLRQLYGTHPYGREVTGDLAAVNALTSEDARHWWESFAHPKRSVLIFAGDIDPAKAVALAEKSFGDWKNDRAVKEPSFSLPVPPSATRIYLIDHPGIQSQIRVGQLSITRRDPKWPTARVVGDYFGGAFNSRLNETIRVKKGLTYGARGGFEPARDIGEFSINTFSKTETTAEAVKAIFDEISRLRSEPPNATELEDTKSHYIGSFPSQRETPQQTASHLWLLESHSLPPDYYDQLLRSVKSTDAASCARAATELVDPAKMVVVVVGNAARIKEDLEKIAPVTILKSETATK
jgi:zinc protease